MVRGADEVTGPERERGSVTLPDGREVAFEVSGRELGGTPLLLIRPLAGSMALWGEFRDVLASRMQVIAYDPPGTGESGEAELELTTRQMAGDVVALLDHLGVERAHVFGLSFGAMVATWLAIDSPSRVARLCLASAGGKGITLTASGVWRAIAMAACLLQPEGEVEACMTAEVLSRDVRDDDPERVDAIKETVEDDPTDRGTLMKHALTTARHDARDELPKIAAPTLVLAGEHDELLGAEPQAELCRAIPGAVLEVVAGAGHDVTLEQPVQTAERVLAFVLGD